MNTLCVTAASLIFLLRNFLNFIFKTLISYRGKRIAIKIFRDQIIYRPKINPNFKLHFLFFFQMNEISEAKLKK